MRVRITKVEPKEITVKATGKVMRLVETQGMTASGDVFKFTLPRDHADVVTGEYEVVAEGFVNYEAKLGGRITLRSVGKPDNRPDPIKG